MLSYRQLLGGELESFFGSFRKGSWAVLEQILAKRDLPSPLLRSCGRKAIKMTRLSREEGVTRIWRA